MKVRGSRVAGPREDLSAGSVGAAAASRCNELGQPIGADVPDWSPRRAPGPEPMEGRFCSLEVLNPEKHALDLWQAVSRDPSGRLWTYLPYGPFDSLKAYRAWLESACLRDDPLFFAILDTTSRRAVGLASYLRIEPSVGVIEVGHLQYSPRLQRTTAATEAMYLMMRRAFDELGYRRYEWKCDALNVPSRRAAERLGFRLEGVFRQATIYKGRNRDTAWYAIVDSEWPRLDAAFRHWLDASNFVPNGLQRRSLSSFRPEGSALTQA